MSSENLHNGVDANGRSLRFEVIDGNGDSLAASPEAYSVAGIPPEYSSEDFVWNSPSLRRSRISGNTYRLEQAWADLQFLDGGFLYESAVGKKDRTKPEDAITQAISQNAPEGRSATITLAIPNLLQEIQQDRLLLRLKYLGLGEPVLIWRPVALAIDWLDKNQAKLLQQSSLPCLWIVDLESTSLEITRFALRVVECNGREFVIPVRTCPEDEVIPFDSFTLAHHVARRLCGNNVNNADQFMAGPYASEFQKKLERQDLDAADVWYQNGLNWKHAKPVRELPRRVWEESVAWHKQGSTVSDHRTLARHLDNTLDQFSFRPSDIILFHGWPCRVTNGRLPIHPRIGGQKIVIPPNAVARGAATYAWRLANGLPTYRDTLPKLSIWALEHILGERRQARFITLVEAVEVEGGETWRLETPIDRFSLRPGAKDFPLRLKRGTEKGFRTLPVELPTAISTDHQEPVLIDAAMKPASGSAVITISGKDNPKLFGEIRRLQADWSQMQLCDSEEELDIERRQLGRLSGFGYPFVVWNEGRILYDNDSTETIERILDSKILLDSQTLTAWKLTALEKVMVPRPEQDRYGNYQPPQGFFGNRMVGLDRMTESLVENLGESLWACFRDLEDGYGGARQRNTICKLLGYMYGYAPKEFKDYLAGLLTENGAVGMFEFYAMGRTFNESEYIEVFADWVNFNLSFNGFPQRCISGYMWAIFRFFFYYPKAALIPSPKGLELVRFIHEYLYQYRNRANAPQKIMKYALCALLFVLRLREMNEEFLTPKKKGKRLYQDLEDVLMTMRTKIRLTGIVGQLRDQGYTFNDLVLKFLQSKASEEDMELLTAFTATLTD